MGGKKGRLGELAGSGLLNARVALDGFGKGWTGGEEGGRWWVALIVVVEDLSLILYPTPDTCAFSWNRHRGLPFLSPYTWLLEQEWGQESDLRPSSLGFIGVISGAACMQES